MELLNKSLTFISNESNSNSGTTLPGSKSFQKLSASEWIVCENISIKRNQAFKLFAGSNPTQSEYILRNANAFFQLNRLNCLIGPSGCGKSTLIKNCFGHLEPLWPEQGSVQLLKQLNNDPLKRKSSNQNRLLVSFVPQDVQLHEALNVAENFSYAYEFKYTSKEYRKKALNHYSLIKSDENDSKSNEKPFSKEKLKQQLIFSVLKQLGISHILHNTTASCSGGEKKRVAIGLELLCTPDILILDEPSTGLDSAISMQLITYLRKLCIRSPMTVIAIIHQPSFELFLKFHNAYVMDRHGHCLYSGRSNMLLKYIKAHGMTCPHFYNPSDLMLDIAQNDFGNKVQESMRKTMQNATSAISKLAEFETQKLDHIRYKPTSLNKRQVMLLAKQWTELNLKDKSLVKMQCVTYLLGPFVLSLAINHRLGSLTGCPPFHLMIKNSLNFTQISNYTQKEWNEFEFSDDNLHLQNIGYLRQFNKIQLTELMGFVATFFVYDALFAYSVVTLAGYAFPAQLQLFLNQRLNGFFSLRSYLASKTFSDLPILTFYCFLTSLVIYLSIGYSLIVPSSQWLNSAAHKTQFCNRLFGNQTDLYGVSSADNTFDQTQDIVKAGQHLELESQSELLLQFGRYFISNMAIFITAQTNGMIVGALLWFSLNASVFISPVSMIPHFLFAELYKDKKIQAKFWQVTGELSPIRNAMRMQVLSIYSNERCQRMQRQCGGGGNFFANHELTKQWLVQQFGLNRGNASLSSGISAVFVENLLNLIYGDYLGEEELEFSPQPLKQFNIDKYTYEENVPLVYGEMLVYRIVFILILLWKGKHI